MKWYEIILLTLAFIVVWPLLVGIGRIDAKYYTDLFQKYPHHYLVSFDCGHSATGDIPLSFSRDLSPDDIPEIRKGIRERNPYCVEGSTVITNFQKLQ